MTQNSLDLELQKYRNLVDERCLELVSGIRYEALREPVASLLASGKRIRPLVTLLSSEASGGSAKDVLDPAMGMELLHAASLVHDDIMDRASLRRGKPTLHEAFGNNIALVCGDYLVALAYEKMFLAPPQFRENALALTNKAYRSLCEGQALEEHVNSANDANLKTFFEILENKTGSLMELAASVGALIGGADEKLRLAFAQFGNWLGVAFQIQDDILDVVGCETETGKDHLLDMKNNKKTFLHFAGAEEVPITEATDERILLAAKKSEECMDRSLAVLREIPTSDARNRLEKFALSLLNRRS